MDKRTVLITGGSRGIGRATALRFARQNANVIIAARHQDELNATIEDITAAGGSGLPVVTDLAQPDDIDRLVATARDRFGRIDILVNNAGTAPLKSIEEMSVDEYTRTQTINVDAVFALTRAVWPIMKSQGGGWIVNISSRASVDPLPGFAVYGATKAWVNIFSQALANEGKPHNIRVHVIAPGGVETGMFRELFPDVPPERVLDPDDVAGTIESVCDPRMDHSVGQPIFVVK